jgi:hypothetical protein
MSMWDDLVATGFEHLADPARYTIAATGETHDVGVIPIDEAETWQARKGLLEITGTKIEARLYAEQMPEGWAGPAMDQNGNPADLLLHNGKTWRVRPIRVELNGVQVVELVTKNGR